MQPHRGGPGEVAAAGAAAAHRAIRLVESRALHQRARIRAHALRGSGMTGLAQPGTDHVVHDSPHRAPPVADRIESRIVGIEARHEVARALGNAVEVLQRTLVARLMLQPGVERQERRARDETGKTSRDRIARAVSADRFVPQVVDACFGALHVAAQLFGFGLAAQIVRQCGKVAIRAQQHHRHADVGDAERMLASDALLIPAHLAARLHQRQVAVVLDLGRPHALIEVRRIAPRVLADARRVDRARRRIPLRRVVATCFPRMHGDHDALAERIANLREPAMPREQLREQLLESRPQTLRCVPHAATASARRWKRPAAG